MNRVKQEYSRLILDGREYEIALTLNVIDKLQSKYETLAAAFTATGTTNGFIDVLLELVNDNVEYHNEVYPMDLWEPLTKAKLARMITFRNLAQVNEALFNAFDLSLPQEKPGNSEAEQR